MTPAQRSKRIAALALLAAASAFLTLEIALRVARSQSEVLRRALYVRGEPVRYEDASDVRSLIAMTPFAPQPFRAWAGFKLDSRGLRTPTYAYEKATGVCRVIALGDSFTFDSGFVPWDSMWHGELGRSLAEQLGRQVEVINLGMPAVGPSFSARMYELEATKLEPDLVILALFVGNDLTDECGATGSFLRRHSAAWRFLARLPIVIAELRAVPPPPARGPGGYPLPNYRYDPQRPINDAATLARIEAETVASLRDPKPDALRCLTETVELLGRLAKEVKRDGAQFVVMLIPDHLQLAAGVARADSALSLRERDLDWVQEELVRRLAREGVAAIDLLPELRRHEADRAPLYRTGDTHFSAEGNRVAAAILGARLSPLLGGLSCIQPPAEGR